MSIAGAVGATVGVVIIGAASIAGLAALGVFGAEYSFRLNQHYLPKYEQVRRETFEQSQAYNEGMRRDIENLRIDWLGATGGQKDAIRALALTRIAGLPDAAVTGPILSFRNELTESSK